MLAWLFASCIPCFDHLHLSVQNLYPGTYSGRARSSERNQHLFDSDEETSPATQIREARYGRRSSQSNGNTDNPGGRGGSGSRYSRPTSDYSDVSDRISSSSSSGQRNRCESDILPGSPDKLCCICMSIFFFLPGISRYEIQARHSLMILGSTVTVPRRQWITPLSRLERDCKRLHPTLPEEDKEKGARGKSCQNSAMSAVQSTLWKMPSSAVNVEWGDFTLILHNGVGYWSSGTLISQESQVLTNLWRAQDAYENENLKNSAKNTRLLLWV